ncbi:ABC transporter permease [uncultured Adlercreutzia sp.]|uniref:ABC transporter permease n=1 Tax=uncultured Adlercreutzia sp. TaxID=875803 RepID=UPI002676883F|nr:ABC transporter permease [uncultured Adlercreutzia sp.]
MRACRYALEIVAKHPIYLIIYVGFLSLMGLFVTSGLYPPAMSDEYEPAEIPFAVIDRDQSELSCSVAAFLAEQGPSVEVPDELRACQDAVATGEVRYLLIVPEGFQESFLQAARERAAAPRLETVFSFESMGATLVDTQVNQYLQLIRAAAALQPEADAGAVVAQAEAASEKAATIREVPAPGEATGCEAFIFYLKWSAYPLTVAVVVSVGILMGAFNRTDVRRRVTVSPASGLSLGLQKALAGLVVALGVCAVIVGIGLAVFGDAAAALPPGALAAVLGLVLAFLLVPLAIAFLLGQLGCGENVSNTVGNIVGMVLSFLGGVWVSADLMPEAVRTAAMFTPVHWLCTGLGAAAASAPGGEVLLCAGVMALFAAAVFAVALVAGRLRAQTSEAGGNAAAAAPR